MEIIPEQTAAQEQEISLETQNEQALYELLDKIREAASTQRGAGTRFETLVKDYLTREPSYRDLYSKIQTFKEWAEAHPDIAANKKDIGIDLVATNADGNGYTAIQCKFYLLNATVSKSDIDSFIAASNTPYFTSRLIVATNSKWGENVRTELCSLTPPVMLITREDLAKSRIDWSAYIKGDTADIPKRKPRPYQQDAINAVAEGFKANDRGKLIMACGTGKTFTALKIAEHPEIAGAGSLVLFLVPSLHLLSQTLTDWKQQSTYKINAFAVCSDSATGKADDEDIDAITSADELQYPATTNPAALAHKVKAALGKPDELTVIFSTYQSIEVISEAQKKYSLPDFDLVICDEAHRTAGGNMVNEDETVFTLVHSQENVRAKKRLYMTATPKIYGAAAKGQKERGEVELYSMDDETVFGPTFFTLSFAEAVNLGCLTDYKVVVLTVDEKLVGDEFNIFDTPIGGLNVSDAAKIIGTWRALSKYGLKDPNGKAYAETDAEPMRRAVAFAQVIDYKEDKVSSKAYRDSFAEVVSRFRRKVLQKNHIAEDAELSEADSLVCETRHIDGTMDATEKATLLHWLKEEPEANHCKILFNVRCLSEGVDVPALDAVVFLTPRKSQVDVVQIVGRVMRIAPGKKKGYVIIPVVTPTGVDPSIVLDNNKDYDVVWQILRALKSIDSRFGTDAVDGQLGKVRSDKIDVVCVSNVEIKRQSKHEGTGQSGGKGKGDKPKYKEHEGQSRIIFDFGQSPVLEEEIKARMVKKVGNRCEWADWAEDVADICQEQIKHINMAIAEDKTGETKNALDRYEKELKATLNEGISRDEIIEMLAQHVVIKPVMDALFSAEEYPFTEQNPIAAAMSAMMETLDKGVTRKTEMLLSGFYQAVKMRVRNIKTPAERQVLIVELFDKFFKAAFPKMQDKLGIVYTPIEIVDFINNSVAGVLKSEFGAEIGDEGVHILDPFTGTGTFITRLMQSGLISKDRLPYKYKHDLHAHEIVPLAYYIACMNVETTYHDIMPESGYEPNDVIIWTDTFKSRGQGEEHIFKTELKANDERRASEDKLDIRVIISNPPYSVGQEGQNDDNQNEHYEELEKRIESTYAARSSAQLNKSLYDSYVKAFRWASDRLDTAGGGIIGFVSNAGWLESNSADGMRKCIAEEFSSVYVYHLKGNARTQGERRKREKDNVFGVGSRAPIAITILVKNPNAAEKGRIYFHAVDDYLTRQDKLDEVRRNGSISNIEWQRITPDEHGDWLNLRDDSFSDFIPVGDKNGNDGIFIKYSCGVLTSRDPWAYNASRAVIDDNMRRSIDFYNRQVELSTEDKSFKPDLDPQKMKWDRPQKRGVTNGRKSSPFDEARVIESLYRPFCKQHLYFDNFWNNCVYQMPKLFPNSASKNLVIMATGCGASRFSCQMTDSVPCFDCMEKAICLPRYLYIRNDIFGFAGSGLQPFGQGVFDDDGIVPNNSGLERIDAISDNALRHFSEAYGREVTADDLFFYIYGILHSEDYRTRYANNLMKELPRIPRVATYEQFTAFRDAGRALGELHVNYENVPPYDGVNITGEESGNYRVVQMKYGKIPGKTGNAAKDKTRLTYNDNITITNIPIEAQGYIVNKKSALDWIVERACVKTDKETGIVNDFNQWGIEHDNPRYPLELFLKVITVSLETMKIVRALPPLDIHPLDREG